MEKVESVMIKIKNLLRKVETVPLKVTKPQLLTAQAVSTDIVVHYHRRRKMLKVGGGGGGGGAIDITARIARAKIVANTPTF